MKKLCSIIIICLISLVFSGCSHNQKSVKEVPDNKEQSADKSEEEDKWQYVPQKVWLAEDWYEKEEVYEDLSLFFSRISDGKIEGNFWLDYTIRPDEHLYSQEREEDYGTITGEYQGNKAQCTLVWDNEKINGTMELELRDKSIIQVKIKIHTNSKKKKWSDERNMVLKPYNFNDEIAQSNRRSVTNEISETPVKLDGWGSVNFVSRVRTSKKTALFLYLTDDDGNILYEFTPYVPNDFQVKQFKFTDVNNDNREDLLLEVCGRPDPEMLVENVFLQNEMGGFVLDQESTPDAVTESDIMQKIDSRVKEVNDRLKGEFYEDHYDNDILMFRYFDNGAQQESLTQYYLYYNEQGKLIYADIAHYRDALYSIYFHNDELLHTEVGPSYEGELFIDGDMENVKDVTEKDPGYAFVLEDYSLCLEKAYD